MNFWKRFLQTASIRTKLIVIIMIVSVVGVFLSYLGFFFYDYFAERQRLLRELRQTGELISNNIAYFVPFDDTLSTKKDLFRVLRRNPGIRYGVVFRQQKVFAYYVADTAHDKLSDEEYLNMTAGRQGQAEYPLPAYQTLEEDFDFWGNRAAVIIGLHADPSSPPGEPAVLYIETTLQDQYVRYRQYGISLIFLMLAALLITYILARWLQRFITSPILTLTYTAQGITDSNDYSVRIGRHTDDEVGTLIEAFNAMLARIEDQHQKLMEAKERAEHLARAKEEFLSNMSHEIRTPMTGVINALDIFGEENLSDDQKRLIGTIRTSADILLSLINDILELSKMEAGKMVFEKVTINLPQILDMISTAQSEKAASKNIRTIVEIGPNVPEMVLGDPVKLSQVLLNLYSNAIKFTPQGTVSMDVNCAEETPDAVLLRFRVQDTGIGISEEQMKKIFISFTQATNDTTRKYGGTGLGLTISKRLVELQNGRMTVESTPGKGSIFAFELWFERMKGTKIITKRKVEVDPDAASRVKPWTINILLAEDHEVNRMVISTLLKKWNFIVDVAVNGKEALEMHREHGYNLILMDVHMPEMDGYEVTRRIRKEVRGGHSQVPIIALTASALSGEEEKCREAGMNDYVTKPFDKNELYAKIVRLVDRE